MRTGKIGLRPRDHKLCQLRTCSPVAARQSQTLLSPEAEARSAESWEKATDMTAPLWPSSVLTCSPVAVRQSRTVLSPEADARSAESWESCIYC